MRERRVVELPPRLHLLPVEGVVVLLRGGLDAIVVWPIALDDNRSFFLPPARSPGDLCQQLKGALGGTEIGEIQRSIR